jgi:pyruvate/2-oxoglutarate dehydrogenase complex dihydrolipoamide acyltransferase (E2) component
VSAAYDEAIELERAIANVYRGSLEEFISRRDALAKELRSAGRRESASAVKALRKPSRLAWALDLAAQDGVGSIDALVAAVASTLEAQAAGGDVRKAMIDLRAAVRDFAGQAARAAEQAGHRAEPSVLANAVLAVLGRPDSFTDLRRGCLTDVPEAGGLDFLTSLPLATEQAPRPAQAKPREIATAPSPSRERAALEAAAREAARQATIALDAARERSENAQRALRETESKLHEAEERLRRVEQEALTLRNERDRARQEADAAATRLHEAERAADEAERQLGVAVGEARHE